MTDPDTLAKLERDMRAFDSAKSMAWADRLSALAKQLEWMPISTAPKDGTKVLVYFDCASVPIVHIAFYRSAKEWDEEGQFCGGWETLDEWEGWWSYTLGCVTQEKLTDHSLPTHWMPLPKGPQP